MSTYWVIIPAAGVGRRMQADVPKQYLEINNKTILERTVDVFLHHETIHRIVVAIDSRDQYWDGLSLSDSPRIITTLGGAERRDTVRSALQAIAMQAQPDDWVLVHDAVRPCVSRQNVERLITALQDHPVGGALGVPVSDTLKRVNLNSEIEATVSRDHLWTVQTPQMFRYRWLYKALQQALADNLVVTDECAAIEHLGLHPLMVLGSATNIKITHPADLVLAEAILGSIE